MTDPSKFELTAGALCLDFANTVNGRARPQPEELLQSYADLLTWGRLAHVMGESGEKLQTFARTHRSQAERQFRRAKVLRDALFDMFAAIAAEDRPSTQALDVLTGELQRANLRLTRQGDSFLWTWGGARDDFSEPLWRIAQSAADLLTSGEMNRVRECAADNCRWLFLDTTRNRSRRWCDMKVCGNRDKVRRFYERHSGE